MNSNQLKLNEIWNKNAISSDRVCFTIANEIRVQSSITSSSSTATSSLSVTTSSSSTITSLLPTVSYSSSTISSSSTTELSSSLTTSISLLAGNSSLSVTVSSLSSTIPSSSLTTFSSPSTTASPSFVSISSSSLLPICNFLAVNRVQTIGRSRLMISTLDVLMTVKMLLKDDLRNPRCRYVVHRAFESWNDQEYNRRFHQIQVLIDTPDDYEPKKQIRSNAKANLTLNDSEILHKNSKKPKSKSINYANGCKTKVSESDPAQSQASQCSRQNGQFNSIEYENNCSHWLCNGCRIKLAIDIDSLWFCADHEDMHDDDDDKSKEN